MRHFIKIVDDLNVTCTTGCNEQFFRGEGYTQISDRMAHSVQEWCQQNLAAVKLKSEGATDNDDALELYVIRFGEIEGKKTLKSFVRELGKIFVAILSETAQAVNTHNVMTSKANEAFDAVEEAARFRTLLLGMVGKRRRSAASALLLDV